MKAILVRNSVENCVMGILFVKANIGIDEIETKIGEFMESIVEKGGCFEYTTDDIISYFPKEWEVEFVETSEMDAIETIRL